ncbi:MAK10-like protein [Tanacetum coccineum]
MARQSVVQDVIPVAISRLLTSVEYRKSLAMPIGLSFTADSLGGLSLGRIEEEIAVVLPNISNLDIEVDEGKELACVYFNFPFAIKLTIGLTSSISTWEDLTTRFLAQFFPPGRTSKLHNDILMFQQHQGESLSEAWTRFKDLLQKVPHHGIDLWLHVQIFYDHDLALYDNESWNDPRDFAKPVKAIFLPQDVPSTSDRRLIELENQVQYLMEAHLAPKQSVQVNKITSSCEICNGPHDTHIAWKIPSKLLASQDARLSKFEADFKQQQVLFARSYLTEDPQCLSHPLSSINAIKTCSKEINHSQKDQLQMVMKFGTQQSEEPERTLEDEFQNLHLNLPVLEVLAHAPIYNAILDKYVESLEVGKNGSTFIQGEMPTKMEDPELFTLPCRLGDSKPFDTLADLGSCVTIIPLYLFKKLKIRLLEETNHVFGLADETKSYLVGIVRDVEVHIGKLKLLNDFYVIDMKKDAETPLLVGRGFLATTNTVIDCRKAKIAVGEGITIA